MTVGSLNTIGVAIILEAIASGNIQAGVMFRALMDPVT